MDEVYPVTGPYHGRKQKDDSAIAAGVATRKDEEKMKQTNNMMTATNLVLGMGPNKTI